MNYEQKYNEALEAAQQIYKDMQSGGNYGGMEDLEVIFPELAESEDERMCTRCIELLRKVSAYSGEEYLGVEIADCIIGLQALRKKQKESLHITETYKENPDSFIDDVGIRQMLIDHFTRYKIGNVSTKLNGFLIDDIIAFVKNQKIPNARQRLAEWSKTEEGKTKYEEVAKEMRREMEKEQKPEERFEEAREKYQVEWSEEDEKMMNEIITIMDGGKVTSGTYLSEYAAWLKSLPERFNLQPKQEWSEADEKMLIAISKALGCDTAEKILVKEGVTLMMAAGFLESLRPSWKPSEEQMEAFRSYIKDFQEKAEAAVGGWNNFDVMIRLFEQLKRLM